MEGNIEFIRLESSKAWLVTYAVNAIYNQKYTVVPPYNRNQRILELTMDHLIDFSRFFAKIPDITIDRLVQEQSYNHCETYELLGRTVGFKCLLKTQTGFDSSHLQIANYLDRIHKLPIAHARAMRKHFTDARILMLTFAEVDFNPNNPETIPDILFLKPKIIGSQVIPVEPQIEDESILRYPPYSVINPRCRESPRPSFLGGGFY